jgi:enamine deaminase RidA (YjgF/YER057c/UK114 family)
MERKFINPGNALNSIPRGYSHAITVSNPGKLVFVAGQGAIDENLNIVGEGDIEAQTRQTFRNLDRTLKESGATMKDIVKMTVFCSDVASQQWPIRNVRGEFIDAENPPTSTMIQVSGFAVKGMMIEIDVIAVVA